MYQVFYVLILLLLSSISLAQNGTTLIPFQHTDGSYGYKEESGRIVIEPQFEAAQAFKGSYASASIKGNWGLITSRGKWAIPPGYDNIGWTIEKESVPVVNGEVTGYQQQGKWGIISVKNKVITGPVYDILTYFSVDYLKVGKLVTRFQQTDTLFGLIDTKGKEVIPASYHFLAASSQPELILAGLSFLYSENKPLTAYGLITAAGQELLPLQYANISEPSPGTFSLRTFQTYYWTDARGQRKAKVVADSLYEISPNIFALISKGKTGVFTPKASVIQARFERIDPERHGFILFRLQNKYGVFTRKADTLQVFLPALYDSLYIISSQFIKAGTRQEGNWHWELVSTDAGQEQIVKSQPYDFIDDPAKQTFIRVKKNNLYGFMRAGGEQLIPLEFDSLGNFTDSLCVAVQKGRAGILKKDGSWHLPPAADSYQISRFGYMIRQEKGKWEVTDPAGKKQYSSTVPLRFLADGSIEITQKGKTGRLSPSGVPGVPALFDSVSVMSGEGTFWAFQGKHIFLYDSQGTALIKEPGKIEYIAYVPHAFSLVKTGGKYGFVDERGRLRISNRYEGGQSFSEGLAAVRFAGKWGFLTKQDKIAIQPYYDEVNPFRGGFTIARKGRKWGLIDKNGKETTDFSYDRIIRDSTGVFLTEKGGKYGLLGKNGIESMYVKYTHLDPLPDGNVRIEWQGKYGLISGKGIVLIPATYDAILYNPFSQSYLLRHSPGSFELTSQQILSGELSRQK